jgi:hypothetical protein
MGKYDNLKSVLGDWSELLGHILYYDTVKDFAKELKGTRALPFDEVFGDTDYFRTVREMPYGEIKAIYIKEYNDEPTQQLREMEEELFDGLCLPLSIQKDFNWLSKQGLVVFPRYYTWGTPTTLHKQWSYFTDEALTIILKDNPKIIVCTNNPEVKAFLFKRIPEIKILPHGPNAWRLINVYIKKVFKTEINWLPKI